MTNVLNDITDTKEWVRHLHSIRSYEWKVPKELRDVLKLGTLTSPLLAADIIRFFTHEGDQVFDPFAGEGGIVIGAALANRLCAGNDLYASNKATAKKVGRHYGRPEGNYWGYTVMDAVKFLEDLAARVPATQDLMFTDPPFGINHGRTLDKGGSVPFNMVGQDARDIGALTTWDAFYEYIARVAELSYACLKPGKYAIFQFGDRNRGGHYRVVGSEATPYIEKAGFVLKGVQHFYPVPPNVRRQVFGWWKAYVALIDHWSLYIYRKEP